MLYFSRWDSPEAARDFAKLYADYLPKRYKKAILQQPAAASGMNSAGTPPAIAFDTDEGKVTLEIQGNDLLILEGYDDKVAEKARASVAARHVIAAAGREERQVERCHTRDFECVGQKS